MMLLLFCLALVTILLIWFRLRYLAIIAFFVCLGAGTGLLLRLMTTPLALNF